MAVFKALWIWLRKVTLSLPLLPWLFLKNEAFVALRMQGFQRALFVCFSLRHWVAVKVESMTTATAKRELYIPLWWAAIRSQEVAIYKSCHYVLDTRIADGTRTYFCYSGLLFSIVKSRLTMKSSDYEPWMDLGPMYGVRKLSHSRQS
ncbi:hypothetical protein HAX54_010337 [Datura stramonium]|uniref:Secreted protein n=1 Tax=Datura stramonium TaxID=4076 RepID=A0ABS8TG34_DATST|nr:hypothetical protein [Datura stramonium]